MRDLVLTLIVFGSVPWMLLRPSMGLLIWSWLGYMNPHRATYGFAYNFPFVQVAAIATFVGILFSKQRNRFPWSPASVLLLVWVAWISITTVFALDRDSAFPGWERLVKVEAMIIVTLLLMQTREQLGQLVWVIVVSIGAFGVKGGIFTAAHGGHYLVWGPPDSFIEGNNELALALLTVIPLMRYLQTQSKNVWIRRGLAASMVLCGLSIVGSYSRGALLGGFAMLFVLWLRSRRKFVLGALLVVIPALLIAFMPSQWSDRMHTIGSYQQDASAEGRINAWGFAWHMALDHPIVGGGFNSFTRANFLRYAPNPEDVHDAHSIYFQVLGEHGFVGLAIFISLGVLAVLNAGWVIRNARGRDELGWARDLAAMTQVSFAGFCVGGAFLGLAYWDLPYHLLAIALLTRVAVTEVLRGGAPAAAAGPYPRTPPPRAVARGS